MNSRWKGIASRLILVIGVAVWAGCSDKHHDHSTKDHDHSTHKHDGKTNDTKASPEKNLENINKLPAGEREAALAQRLCPVGSEPLGSMGVPLKVTAKARTLFLCCKGCQKDFNADPDTFLKKLDTAPAVKSNEQKDHKH